MEVPGESAGNVTNRVKNTIGLFVLGLSMLVLLDWCAPPYVHRLQDDWVTQKVSTALLFLMGTGLVFAKHHRTIDAISIAIVAFSTLAIFVGIGPAEVDAVRTTRSGIPSFFTVLGFWSLVLSAMLDRRFAWIPIGLGVIALVGYGFASPALAWEYEWSSGMAFVTALDFVLLGAIARLNRGDDGSPSI